MIGCGSSKWEEPDLIAGKPLRSGASGASSPGSEVHGAVTSIFLRANLKLNHPESPQPHSDGGRT